jgi:hypothetical protein
MIDIAEVSASAAMRQLNVRVRLRGVRSLRWRLWLSAKLFVLAGIVTGCKVVVGFRRLTAETCGDCGHFFDPADKRAHIPSDRSDRRWTPVCPCCATMTLSGDEAWAVWNSCQGVFTCGVAHSRAAAVEKLKDYDGVADKVIPVRVYAEPEDRRDMREWSERQFR